MSLLGILLLGLGAVASATVPDSIALPQPDRSGSVALERVLQSRRSVRDLDVKPIPLASVAQLLWAAQGVTSRDGHRTAPSAGALYPLELIVVATRVDGLDPGIYRYVPADHSLRRVAPGRHGDALARAALGQQFIADAAAVVVVAAVERRTAAKYGQRAARYVAFEAGCASQNLLLEAVSLGMGSVVVGAFDDRRVTEIIRLDSGEAPVVLLPVGFPHGGAR